MWVDNKGTRLTSRGGYYSDNIQGGILSAGPNNLISLNVGNGGFRALVMIGSLPIPSVLFPSVVEVVHGIMVTRDCIS
jgi:hypothetical protein